MIEPSMINPVPYLADDLRPQLDSSQNPQILSDGQKRAAGLIPIRSDFDSAMFTRTRQRRPSGSSS